MPGHPLGVNPSPPTLAVGALTFELPCSHPALFFSLPVLELEQQATSANDACILLFSLMLKDTTEYCLCVQYEPNVVGVYCTYPASIYTYHIRFVLRVQTMFGKVLWARVHARHKYMHGLTCHPSLVVKRGCFSNHMTIMRHCTKLSYLGSATIPVICTTFDQSHSNYTILRANL